MSEELTPVEAIKPPDPILRLATECGVVTSEKSDLLMSQIRTGMEEEEKMKVFIELHTELQRISDEVRAKDGREQIHRDIGIMLMKAHVNHVSGGDLEQVLDDLYDAYTLANQSSMHEGHAELQEIAQNILTIVDVLNPPTTSQDPEFHQY